MTWRQSVHRCVSNPNRERRFQQALFLCTILSLTSVQMTLWMTWNMISPSFYFELAHLARPPKQKDSTEIWRFDSEEDNPVSSIPPFRILLGIFTYNKKSNGKLQRELIRRTYLSLPEVLERHNISTIPLRHSRICSLQDYSHKTIEQPEQCQILYTFVIGGNTEKNAPLEYLAPVTPGRSLTVNVSDPEPDVVYLNIKENMDFGKTNTWLHYASTEVPDEINIVAKVDTDSLVYPNVILEVLEAAFTNPDTVIFGGTQINNSRNHSYMQGGFYFLSRHLARALSIDRENRWNVVQNYWKAYRYQRPEDVETGQLVKAFGGSNVTWLDIPEDKAWVHRKGLKEEPAFLNEWDDYVSRLIALDRLTKMEQQHGECHHLSVSDRSFFLESITTVKAKDMFSSLLFEKMSSCKNNTRRTE